MIERELKRKIPKLILDMCEPNEISDYLISICNNDDGISTFCRKLYGVDSRKIEDKLIGHFIFMNKMNKNTFSKIFPKVKVDYDGKSYGDKTCLTKDGARLIVNLYLAELLPMTKKWNGDFKLQNTPFFQSKVISK